MDHMVPKTDNQRVRETPHNTRHRIGATRKEMQETRTAALPPLLVDVDEVVSVDEEHQTEIGEAKDGDQRRHQAVAQRQREDLTRYKRSPPPTPTPRTQFCELS